MDRIKLVSHAPGAPGLRLFGLGPGLIPMRGIFKLQQLLNKHSFWAKSRSFKDIKTLLRHSTAVISIWSNKRMVGFGRATSDCIYRAVLWDVVVAEDLQGVGLGREVVEALLKCKEIKEVEKVYLMTTKGSNFYKQIGFVEVEEQKLMIKRVNNFPIKEQGV
mgnify:CR=1 FL=1